MRKTPSLFRALLLLSLSFFFLGWGGRGSNPFAGGRPELKPEIRLKIYSQAIEHYEKAEALYRAGRPAEALKELKNATRTFSEFPEAYDLARKIYLELGDEKRAKEEEELFLRYKGHQGASLYKLREKVREQVENRRRLAPPPDIAFLPSLLISMLLAAVSILGMIYEYRFKTRAFKDETGDNSIILEPFPSQTENQNFVPGPLFKLLTLFLPGPLLFSILLLLGFQSTTDVVPVLSLCWVAIDLITYLIFFADFSDVSGMRRSGNM